MITFTRLIFRMKKFYFVLFLLRFFIDAQAQTVLNKPSKPEVFTDTIIKKYGVTPGRQQLILMIERELKKADIADGVYDKMIDQNGDVQKTNNLSNTIFKKTNRTIAYIENNETDDALKRKYLGRIIENLKLFNTDINDGMIEIAFYQALFENTYQIVRGVHNHTLKDYIKDNISNTLYMQASLFSDDQEATNILMEGMGEKYPEILIKKLHTITNPMAADIIVAKAAPKNPKLLLNYATSTSVERDIVRRNQDPYVKIILKIADSCTTPLKGIFFVEEVVKGKMTIAAINKVTENPDEFFKKMIELRQVYFASDLRKIYDRELIHEASRYVGSMNELHEAVEGIRFKCIEKFSAIEIYYIIVYGSDDLYTSSFLGCYNRMVTRMKPKSGNEFLTDIKKDKFRTFLRLCANYNTISSFLGTMNEDNKKELMKGFVSDLDKTLEGDLEGATDVANSFGSITDSLLRKEITEEIRLTREKNKQDVTSKGYKIYDILYSMLTSSNDSLTKKFGIPPISVMPYSQLVNDSGIVVQQVFFFGDVDGKGVFNSFVGTFGAPDWKVKREENWVKISSIKGKRVDIYANMPKDEPDDELAQNALQMYLDENDIRPSVIIHRGHSYHLSSTLEHINSRHKVVILGACGAYQNLSLVIGQSEDAHIVSTKQIGSGKINGPIIRAFNQRLLEGKDINWVEIWDQLSKQFATGEMKQLFDDYVPPFKNLGALFLKAYRKSGDDY